jgi:hypothetical protein
MQHFCGRWLSEIKECCGKPAIEYYLVWAWGEEKASRFSLWLCAEHWDERDRMGINYDTRTTLWLSGKR